MVKSAPRGLKHIHTPIVNRISIVLVGLEGFYVFLLFIRIAALESLQLRSLETRKHKKKTNLTLNVCAIGITFGFPESPVAVGHPINYANESKMVELNKNVTRLVAIVTSSTFH